MLKSLTAFLFYLNMVDQTEHNFLSPFCDDKYVTIAANFRFQCETLKVNLTACVFFNLQSGTVASSCNR